MEKIPGATKNFIYLKSQKWYNFYSYSSRPDKLKIHLRNVHQINFKCEMCDRSFFKEENLKKHIKIVHKLKGMTNHKCDQCTKSFGNLSTLKTHIKQIHGVKDGKHKCDKCEFAFDKVRDLNKHMRTVHEESPKNHKCKQCDSAFGAASYLTRDGKLTLRHEKNRMHFYFIFRYFFPSLVV